MENESILIERLSRIKAWTTGWGGGGGQAFPEAERINAHPNTFSQFS